MLAPTGVAMVRALRIASDSAVVIVASALWPGLPRPIAASLAIVGFVAVCMQIAFRLHDSNLARNDVSLRD